jgi:hypothetical protein
MATHPTASGSEQPRLRVSGALVPSAFREASARASIAKHQSRPPGIPKRIACQHHGTMSSLTPWHCGSCVSACPDRQDRNPRGPMMCQSGPIAAGHRLNRSCRPGPIAAGHRLNWTRPLRWRRAAFGVLVVFGLGPCYVIATYLNIKILSSIGYRSSCKAQWAAWNVDDAFPHQV